MKVYSDNPLETLVNALNEYVEIGKDVNGYYTVRYKNADIYNGPVRKTVVGMGKTIMEAANDYIHQISGQKLIFGDGENAKIVQLVILICDHYHL